MLSTCKWKMNILVAGGSHYKVECGEIDNLRYYPPDGCPAVSDHQAYYSFIYCPYCGKEIERI